MLSHKWKFDLVEIIWLDAEGEPGWKSETELREKAAGAAVTSVGFLFKKDKTHYFLAGSIYKDDSDHHLGSRDSIPRGMVQSITVLVPKNTSRASAPEGA